MSALVLQRLNLTKTFTEGEWTVEDDHIGWSLEDPVRERKVGSGWVWLPSYKVPGKTAIPSGTYKVILSKSPRFGRVLPEILGVQSFTAIRAHGGNDIDDTEGCPLVARQRAAGTGRVWDCAPALNRLIEVIRNLSEFGDVMLEVRNP